MNTRRVTTLCSLALIGVLCFDDDVESSVGAARGHSADGFVMNSDGSGGEQEMDLAMVLSWLDDSGYGDDSSGSDGWGGAEVSSGWRGESAGVSNGQVGSYDGGGWSDSSLPPVYYDQNEYSNPESPLYDPYEVDSEGHLGGAYENPDSGYYSPSYDSYDGGGSFDSYGGGYGGY